MKLVKLVSWTVIAMLLNACSSKPVIVSNSSRIPASEQIAMGGEWCESASVKVVENSTIEVKLKNLSLEADRNRDHRSCQIAIPLQVAEGQSLKIKNFFVGNAAKIDGVLDFWQERRELVAQGRPVLGGVLTRRQDNLTSYDYKESQLGRMEFACGQSQVLKLDLSHTIVSLKNEGEVDIESPSYRIEYEISECRKPASAAPVASEVHQSAPVFKKLIPIPCGCDILAD